MVTTNQAKASWVFGVLFTLFILGVFAFGPESLPAYKQQILAYVCALLAGCFALFFTGALLVHAELPMQGKWTVQGGAGFGLFLVVRFWWQSPSALIGKQIEASRSERSSGSGSKASAPALKPVASQAREPTAAPEVTLESASVTFHTEDDDKDLDTRLSVKLEKAGTMLAFAESIGDGVTFANHTTYGPFNVPVLVHISQAHFSGIVTHIRIQANGNDTWKSRADMSVKFSDGTVKHQSIVFTLSQAHSEQAWDW